MKLSLQPCLRRVTRVDVIVSFLEANEARFHSQLQPIKVWHFEKSQASGRLCCRIVNVPTNFKFSLLSRIDNRCRLFILENAFRICSMLQFKMSKPQPTSSYNFSNLIICFDIAQIISLPLLTLTLTEKFHNTITHTHTHTHIQTPKKPTCTIFNNTEFAESLSGPNQRSPYPLRRRKCLLEFFKSRKSFLFVPLMQFWIPSTRCC